MNKKIELLKELIETSSLTTQIKLNTIVQTLQKTDDIMKAKMLSEKILAEDFSSLRESAIENLIEAFSKSNTNESSDNSIIIDSDNKDKDNKTKDLEYELKTLKLKMESIEYSTKKKLQELENKNKELEDQNKKLASKLLLTSYSELIEVSDDDINELYIKHLENGNTTLNNAFILNDIIPKTYYKIK